MTKIYSQVATGMKGRKSPLKMIRTAKLKLTVHLKGLHACTHKPPFSFTFSKTHALPHFIMHTLYPRTSVQTCTPIPHPIQCSCAPFPCKCPHTSTHKYTHIKTPISSQTCMNPPSLLHTHICMHAHTCTHPDPLPPPVPYQGTL